MLPIAIALALAAQAAPDPAAGDWLEIGRNEDRTVSIDETRTRRDGDLVRMRVRVERLRDDGPMHWGVVDLEFNCRSEDARMFAAFEYDSGRVLLRSADAAQLAALRDQPIEGEFLRSLQAGCHRTGWGEEE